MRSDFLNLYEQQGVFSYAEDGFTVQLGVGPRKYLYQEIVAIIAFTVKWSSYDEIRLEIFFDDYILRISEAVPGWYEFVRRTKAVFPAIPQDWDLQLPSASPAMDLVMLYTRPGDALAARGQ